VRCRQTNESACAGSFFFSRLFRAVAAIACFADNGPPTNPGPGGSTIPEGFRLELQQIATGLSSPLVLTAPPGDARMFVALQSGLIRIISDGQLLPTPFLDIRPRVSSGGERGLLGLAFHPNYENNGYFLCQTFRFCQQSFS
jgi:glucose/arabinose dehydrogenase